MDNAKATADFFQQALYPEEEIVLSQEEYSDGVQDVYFIGDEVWLIMTHDKKVQQVNLANLDSEEVTSSLNLIEFPKTDSITSFLENNKNGSEDKYDSINLFTKYESVGILLSSKSEVIKEASGDKPFSLIIIYDKDRINYFSERYK